jgi:hypothetical protein
MSDPKAPRPLTRNRRRLAWAIALLADGIQIVLWPAFFAGAVSPVDDVLDVGVSVAMFALLGFHPALLPAFALKLLPGIDLAPTWTIAVWAATRGRPDAALPDAAPATEPAPVRAATSSMAEVVADDAAPLAPPTTPESRALPPSP